MPHEVIIFLGSSEFCVGGFFILVDFFAYPLRSLNDFPDPSKATSARPRKLGLRPQTVRVRPAGRFLRPRRVPRKFIGPLRGHAGLGEKPKHLFFQKPLHPVNRSAHKHAHSVTTCDVTKPGRHGRARFSGRGEVLRCPKRACNQHRRCMPARTCEPGCRKKKRIMNSRGAPGRSQRLPRQCLDSLTYPFAEIRDRGIRGRRDGNQGPLVIPS